MCMLFASVEKCVPEMFCDSVQTVDICEDAESADLFQKQFDESGLNLRHARSH